LAWRDRSCTVHSSKPFAVHQVGEGSIGLVATTMLVADGLCHWILKIEIELLFGPALV
jgi:hypothetical protein